MQRIHVGVADFLYDPDDEATWDYDAAMRHGHAKGYLAMRLHHLIWDACTELHRLRSVDGLGLIHVLSSPRWLEEPDVAVKALAPIAIGSDVVTSHYYGQAMQLFAKCATARQQIARKYGGVDSSTTDAALSGAESVIGMPPSNASTASV